MPSQAEEMVSSMGSLEEPLLNGSDDIDEANSSLPAADTTSTNKDVVLPSCGSSSPLKLNYNVFLNLVLAALYGISNSIWNGTAYAAYLKKLGNNSNGPLGNIEAVSGLSSLLVALPMGYIADKIGRAKVIRAGGLMMLVTIVAQMLVLEWVGTEEDDHGQPKAISYDRNVALWMMGIIMAFWGIGDGVVNGPCNALFADSTPEGQRTRFFNYLFVSYTAASSCGPIVSIILFQTLGDVWDLYHLRIVMYVGLSLEVFNSLLMTLFDDRKALEESDEDEGNSVRESSTGGDDERDTIPLLVQQRSQQSDSATPSSTEGLYDPGPSNTSELMGLSKRQKWIPYIVFCQGLIFAVGSGMTIKFFPLFFKDEVGMTPSQVQIIYCIVPLVMAVSSTLCTQLASSGFGRVQAMLLYSVAGVSLLYSMVFFKSYLDYHPFLLVPIYILRSSLMNGSYPVQESILMDFVPKQERARWKSLDSVASFGWCGSAAFGGWLADKYDYTATFLITAILQSIGIAVWCLLLPLVPRTEGCHSTDESLDEQDNTEDNIMTSRNDIHAVRDSSKDVAEMRRRLGVASTEEG
jgi:MFS family permease